MDLLEISDPSELAAIEATAREFAIGTNLAWYPATSGESDPLIFLDQIKAATPFQVNGGAAGFDTNGYVSELARGAVASSVLLNRSPEVDGIAPLTGMFRLYGQGEGQFRVTQSGQGDLVGRVWASTLPTEEIGGESWWYVDMPYDASDPDETGVKLKIVRLAEDDYIHDLALVHHDHLDGFRAGATFAPEFLEDLQGYDTLRFMQWMDAGRYEQGPGGAPVAPEARYIDGMITADTVLSFDFASDVEGEIHGIGFVRDGKLDEGTVFQLDGSQSYGIQDHNGLYTAGSGARHYDIAVGDRFTGRYDQLVLITDDDAGRGADSTFSDIRLGVPDSDPLDLSGVAAFQPGIQDRGGVATVTGQGTAVTLTGNAWKDVDIRPDHFTFNTRAGNAHAENVFVSSVPVDLIVELANTIRANAWISLPVDITDARAEAIAAEVAATLDPGLSVYWEYGNELWNSAPGFEGYTYAERAGGRLFGLNGEEAVVEWAAYRGPQVYDLIDDHFAIRGTGEARFVAPLWAFDAPSVGSWEQVDSYSRMYFAAAAAQGLADAPPAPAAIVTDYAIGLYTGANDDTVAAWISEAYADPSARAAALARWALFGADPDSAVSLDGAALRDPPEVAGDVAVAVGALIADDVADGLDPLRELDRVLRLDGRALQYRGAAAADWTTVLTFASAPAATLDEMIAQTRLIGYGRTVYGGWVDGMLSSVANQAFIRLDGHKDYVDELGLSWVAYEGNATASQVDRDAAAAFRDEGWAALVLNRWFDRLDAAGVDTYLHYTSHARVAEQDSWGARDHVGQPLQDVPVAQLLADTIAAVADPETPVQRLRDEIAAFGTAAWSAGGGWSMPGDGTATETAGSKDVLSNDLRADVSGGTAYRLSFAVSGDIEDLGTLIVKVKARGGGMTTLVSTVLDVHDGDLVTLDLGVVPASRDGLQVIFRRHQGRDGSLTLSDLALSEVAPDPVKA